VVATHDLGEVEELCTRAAVLAEGRIIGEGPPEEAGRLLGMEAS
jgi:ABC-type multidrug transport system ATPase subunit